MVRPTQFRYNTATATSNAFQQTTTLGQKEISENAKKEFDKMVTSLKEKGIEVFVMDNTTQQVKPDAVFPNNWISLHQDGTLCLYPMLTKNRQLERETHMIEWLKEEFEVKLIKDFSHQETKGHIVEETGSIIFDHPNKITYACRSERTSASLFKEICKELGYSPLLFNAVDERNQSIYHTNVMLALWEA